MLMNHWDGRSSSWYHTSSSSWAHLASHMSVISPHLLGCEILRHLAGVWLWNSLFSAVWMQLFLVSRSEAGKKKKIKKKHGACSFQWKVFSSESWLYMTYQDSEKMWFNFCNGNAFFIESCDKGMERVNVWSILAVWLCVVLCVWS